MARAGLIVIDKPAGPTSHDVVQRVRQALGIRRVGHGGTLDPGATGVLLVAVGQATRLFPYLAKDDKVYEGGIRLGFATDTYDAWGRRVTEETAELPNRGGLLTAMKAFEGRILQTPPRFSAKKLSGTPSYKLARADREFSLKPVAVTVARFDLVDYRPPELAFEVECSAGTYVRALAHDLGRKLGCGAHLASLRRTTSGSFGLADAVTLEDLEEAARRGDEARHIRPLERLLPRAPAIVVRPEAEVCVRNGRLLEPAQLLEPPGRLPRREAAGEVTRILSSDGRLLALGRPTPDGTALHPFLVLS